MGQIGLCGVNRWTLNEPIYPKIESNYPINHVLHFTPMTKFTLFLENINFKISKNLMCEKNENYFLILQLANEYSFYKIRNKL